MKVSNSLYEPASLPKPCLLRALCASSNIATPKCNPNRCCFSNESRIIRPVDTIPTRSGHFAIFSCPVGDMIRSSGSNQAFLWVCHLAQGIPSLSIISTCHCSQSVAGAKIITGLRFLLSRSLSKHNERAAVAIERVFPRPTSSAINKRTMPWLW